MELYAKITRFRLTCQLVGKRKSAQKARKGNKIFVHLPHISADRIDPTLENKES